MYSVDELRNIYDTQQLLVVMLCRLYFNKASVKDVQHFIDNTEVDYSRFTHLCNIHGISPFVFHVINNNGIIIDKATMDRFKQHFLGNQAKCLEQAMICEKLQGSFAVEDILLIPYKGITFSAKYYGNVGLRESSDIDFIVDENKADEIEQHLINSGYQPKTTVPPTYRKYYRNNFKDISYKAPAFTKDDGYSIEMHWKLVNPYFGKFVSFDYFRKGLIEQKIGTLHFKSLLPHHDMVAICSNHFVKDLSSRFKYIVDVAALIHLRDSEVDWNEFAAIMNKYGFQKRVAQGLFIVNALLGMEVPVYRCGFYFQRGSLSNTLEYKLIKIKISNPAFIKRSLQLQDSFFHACRFLLRCMYYYTLPMANEIPAKSYPIPLLIGKRLAHVLKKAIKTI